jgi:predicted DNA-binding transcriptional regulator YafY
MSAPLELFDRSDEAPAIASAYAMVAGHLLRSAPAAALRRAREDIAGITPASTTSGLALRLLDEKLEQRGRPRRRAREANATTRGGAGV